MIFIFVFVAVQVFSQVSDTTQTKKKGKRNPTLASAMSAIVPGSGQIYNASYWKAPIVWGGMGALLYFAIDNNAEYQKFRTANKYRKDGDPNTIDEVYPFLADEDIQSEMEKWRRWRDLDYIICAGVYVLNIIDASVDAHLYSYDVSDDLSFNINPTLLHQNNKGAFGLKLKITF